MSDPVEETEFEDFATILMKLLLSSSGLFYLDPIGNLQRLPDPQLCFNAAQISERHNTLSHDAKISYNKACHIELEICSEILYFIIISLIGVFTIYSFLFFLKERLIKKRFNKWGHQLVMLLISHIILKVLIKPLLFAGTLTIAT